MEKSSIPPTSDIEAEDMDSTISDVMKDSIDILDIVIASNKGYSNAKNKDYHK
jgi:hypothetical protein